MLRFEHRREALLPRPAFFARLLRSGAIAVVVLSASLVLGVFGYHWFGELDWLDALVNASMILSGMGPVDDITTVGGKWFESAYALFSGVAFLTSVGVFVSPAIHRFLHKFHIENEGSER